MNSLSKKIILISGLGISLLFAYMYLSILIPSNNDHSFNLYAHASATDLKTAGEQSLPAALELPQFSHRLDFYDFLVIDEKRIGILVADVSGHGVPASLIASMVKIAFVSQAPHASDPARVLAGINQILCGKLDSDFVTAGYLFIDTEQQTASYAGAGHPPLLLWRQQDKEVLEIRPKGIILGQMEETSYKHSDLKLQKNDRFVLYPDGIVEALNPAGKIYGADRLKTFIEANSGLAAEQFCGRLVDTIAGWSGRGSKNSRDDDLTLLVVDFETAAT